MTAIDHEHEAEKAEYYRDTNEPKPQHKNAAALKPCPFCGEKPRHGLTKVQYCQLHGDPYQNYFVECPKGCGRMVCGGKERAFARWNHRAETPIITKALASKQEAEAGKLSDYQFGEIPLCEAIYLEFEAEIQKLKPGRDTPGIAYGLGLASGIVYKHFAALMVEEVARVICDAVSVKIAENPDGSEVWKCLDVDKATAAAQAMIQILRKE